MKFITCLLFFVTSINCLAQTDKSESAADYKITGEAKLTTHFIEKGLSYSDSNPAMSSSFLFNLGTQVKLGVWGSNVSNLNAADDNFWFKILSRIDIEFSDKFFANLVINDNHFYKSNQRNGQNIAFNFNYRDYEFGLEWMSNYEGTRSNGEYIWGGKLFDYKKNFKYGGYAGFTNTHTSGVTSYFDLKALGQYQLNSYTNLEAGLTAVSNSSQFGSRSRPAFYFSVQIIY